jgi:hypothetical protein
MKEALPGGMCCLLIRPGMAKARLREPVVGELPHAFPRAVAFIAPTAERLPPSPDDLVAERFGHHAALPYAELPQFMEELRANGSLSARASEFTILTAARTGETSARRGTRST